MMDMEYNRTSPFISNCLHYSSEFHPYVGEFLIFATSKRTNPTDCFLFNNINSRRSSGSLFRKEH